ncbi:hypothetical protein QR98_0073440 [Sarcoptes scabiei]|uniref:Uncharacterized protein n=1 Tax=Sarcoptes scabiei TaxID=52283 RepID=A0A132AD82_SARSC|nr:hypothetical protein QR98_0073440 [Sarcoptes scabiei]
MRLYNINRISPSMIRSDLDLVIIGERTAFVGARAGTRAGACVGACACASAGSAALTDLALAD